MTALLLLLLPLSTVRPDGPLVLTGGADLYEVGPHLWILEDPAARWTFEDVTSGPPSVRFTANHQKTPHFGYTSAAYWLRFRVEMEDRREWLLAMGDRSLDRVAFHTSAAGSPVLHTGDGIPFASRPVRDRNLLFPLPEGSSYDVFVRVQSDGPLRLPLRIVSAEAYAQTAREEQFALGIFFGILAFVALVNLALFVVLRDASYLFFAAFIGSFVFYQASVERITFEYLWPDNLWWMDRANSFLAVFCAGWGILFTRRFLDTRRYAPLPNRVLIGLAAACIPLLAFAVLGPPRIVNEAVVHFFIIVVVVLAASAVVCVVRGDRDAVHYLIAWTVLLLGVLGGMFGYLGFLPEMPFGKSSIRFGAAAGIILLSQIGLGIRYGQMRREREELRMRIATDLHDEIGSGLTQISLYSELIRQASAGRVAVWAEEMGDHARALTGKMQDIVWAVHPTDERWIGLELRMKDYSSRLLSPQDVTFDMKGEIDEEPGRIELYIRKNLLLMYKEIVHNSVRHSECQRVTVRYRISGGTLWMRICDDGKGFDPETVQENNGHRNLQYRSREIDAKLSLTTKPGGPTCYEISVPLSINHPIG